MNIFLIQNTIDTKSKDSIKLINKKIEKALKSSYILTKSTDKSLTLKKIHNYKSNGHELIYKNLHLDNNINIKWTNNNSLAITINITKRAIFFMLLISIPLLIIQGISIGWVLFTITLCSIIYFVIRASGIGAVERIRKIIIKEL